MLGKTLNERLREAHAMSHQDRNIGAMNEGAR